MIWQDCDGPQHITEVKGNLYRLVESQEQVATLSYVDTLAEQAILEELLEQSKPISSEQNSEYHYLLTTPFRYPPLKWGSRFGRTNETSLFYAACDTQVTLAESAYYRFVFWFSMEGEPAKPSIRSEHTLFSASYQTLKGIKLHQLPFSQFQNQLTHPENYHHTQQLGTDMREAGIVAFEYASARDKEKGTCVALFSLNGFSTKRPEQQNRWLCETSAKSVAFKSMDENIVIEFLLDDFLVNGKLPLPA